MLDLNMIGYYVKHWIICELGSLWLSPKSAVGLVIGWYRSLASFWSQMYFWATTLYFASVVDKEIDFFFLYTKKY